MLTTVRTRRGKKRREGEEDHNNSSPPSDTIADPLREPESDPLRVTELRDALADELARYEAQEAEKEEERRAQKAQDTEQKAALVDALNQDADEDDAALTVDDLHRSVLEPEEIPALMEMDDLGAVMSELGETDALDLDDPVVEAVIEDDLEEATAASSTGFANAFVDTDAMVENERRSQNRPFHNADTQMQVQRMSWVPNRLKIPAGRRATMEPLVERGLDNNIKQDVSTKDEDHDLGVRTRSRFTPGLPDADTVMAGMGASEQHTALADITSQVQAYHEVMQDTPDFGKTFALGQIRMLERWVSAETPRLDLAEGKTPLDWVSSTYLPAIISDMKVLQTFFDVSHDMIFYRQWLSEILRVVRKAAEKLEEQQRLRDEQEAHAEREDLLASIPEGELLAWSMENPEPALDLYEDPEFRDAYSERLLNELFSDSGVQGYLAQVDGIAAALLDQQRDAEDDTIPDTSTETIQEALLSMDIERLQGMLVLPEMTTFEDQIQASILAIGNLAPDLRGILLTMMTRYGAKNSALADLAHDNPGAAVLAVTRGPDERPLHHALVPPTEAPAVHPPPLLPAETKEEDDEEDEDNEGEDEAGVPTADPAAPPPSSPPPKTTGKGKKRGKGSGGGSTPASGGP